VEVRVLSWAPTKIGTIKIVTKWSGTKLLRIRCTRLSDASGLPRQKPLREERSSPDSKNQPSRAIG
jgi:hypothetical protein